MTSYAMSISEFKRNPSASVKSCNGNPVAVLNHNQPDFYAIPREAFEAIMDRLEDAELNAIADARQNQPTKRVSINELRTGISRTSD